MCQPPPDPRRVSPSRALLRCRRCHAEMHREHVFLPPPLLGPMWQRNSGAGRIPLLRALQRCHPCHLAWHREQEHRQHPLLELMMLWAHLQRGLEEGGWMREPLSTRQRKWRTQQLTSPQVRDDYPLRAARAPKSPWRLFAVKPHPFHGWLSTMCIRRSNTLRGDAVFPVALRAKIIPRRHRLRVSIVTLTT